MKAFNLSNVCLIAAILIGLTAVWSVAAPGEINGDVVGGAGCCSGAPYRTCSGDNCTAKRMTCDTAGTGSCVNSGTPSACSVNNHDGCQPEGT